MNEKRGSLYLVTGLVVGVVLGLLYAWVLRPVQYVNTTPASLSAEYKDKYRSLIAAAYMSNGDLVRAKARLGLLDDADVYTTLAQQAQRALADGSSPDTARALGMLSVALGQGEGPGQNPAPAKTTPSSNPSNNASLRTATSPAIIGSPATSTAPAQAEPAESLAPTDVSTAVVTTTLTIEPPQPGITATVQPTVTSSPTPTVEPTVTPTPTLLPTRTATPTPGAPFVLDKQEKICDQSLGEPQIQVETFDAMGQPVPGVEVVVTWEGGEEHFYTGLKPELGLGYADFTMTPEQAYNLRLAEGGQPITDLVAPECDVPGGERYWGAWHLTFVQP